MTTNKNVTSPIVFQVTDWATTAHVVDLGDEEVKKYVVRLYGLTEDGKKVFVEATGFNPYFYVKIPEDWDKNKVNVLMSIMKKNVELQDKNSNDIGMANSILKTEIVDKCIFKEFNNYKKFKFIKIIFHSHEGFKAYTKAFNKKVSNALIGNNKKYEAYETNIDPLFRFMHIQNLKSMGIIKISKYTKLEGNKNISTNEIAITTNYKNVLPDDNNSILPIVVASFDLECTSTDGSFPQPKRSGDQIIQVGTTFNRHGEDECFYKSIITLGTCEKIDGVEVIACATETQLILEWTKLIVRMNPDIIAGYNIFGFDYPYIRKRAKLLGCLKDFEKLGRIKNARSIYKKKDLSSAALGKNILKYYEIEGRVNIDVMKVIQRDHKLQSYKLDNVAADFIKDEIAFLQIGDSDYITKDNCNEQFEYEGNTTKIYTKGIYGLEVGRVIKISFNDGLSDNSYNDDAKYEVIDIQTGHTEFNDKTYDMIEIKGILGGEALMLDKYTIYWCQAKDDCPPSEIFALQKGSAKDRKRIGVYCLQDCVLVNKLINKLQIITNNCGMANVSSVPFSYIFMRGQGIKGLSLVSKKCQERDHVMPVLKQPYVDKEKQRKENALKTKAQLKAEKEEHDRIYGYEGATVIEPKTGVYLDDPVVVMDYNSLYPNSIRSGNFSQECKVVNDYYKGLDEYYYEEVTYNNNDGSTKTCVYVKPKDPNAPRGIIPEILTELLNARAYTRDLQKKVEAGSFEWDVLEGLQLAYKCTANSLYGQLGAPTSPIYDKDIAASTTKTGRKMLNAASIYAEMIFDKVLRLIHAGDWDGYCECMNLLFDKKVDEVIGVDNVELLKKDGKYEYLEVFKNNTLNIDKKFVDSRNGVKCREDYLRWYYDAMRVFVCHFTHHTVKTIYGRHRFDL